MIGSLGGIIFNIFLLPLPWVLGPAFIVAISALFRIKVAIPPNLRNPFIGILGVWLGSSFDQSIFHNANTWMITLILLALYIPLAFSVTFFIIHKFRNVEKPEAFFIASPGGLLEMVLGAEECKADSKQVGITHMIRIFLTVFTIPSLILIFFPGSFQREQIWPTNDVNVLEFLKLLLVVYVGIYIGRLIKLPGPRLFGPLLLSAVINIFEIFELNISITIVIFAQLVSGSYFGSNFNGLSWKIAGKYIGHSITVVISLITCMLPFIAIIYFIGEIAPAALILAFAPGGVNEMGLLAFLLNIEPAFVITHHLFRLSIVLVILGFAEKFLYPKLKLMVKERSKF